MIRIHNMLFSVYFKRNLDILLCFLKVNSGNLIRKRKKRNSIEIIHEMYYQNVKLQKDVTSADVSIPFKVNRKLYLVHLLLILDILRCWFWISIRLSLITWFTRCDISSIIGDLRSSRPKGLEPALVTNHALDHRIAWISLSNSIGSRLKNQPLRMSWIWANEKNLLIIADAYPDHDECISTNFIFVHTELILV